MQLVYSRLLDFSMIEPLNNEMTETYSTSSKRKVKKPPSECRICGSTAVYCYFGVIACEACKVFFRRNAQYGEVSCIALKGNHLSKYLSLESFEMYIQWSM